MWNKTRPNMSWKLELVETLGSVENGICSPLSRALGGKELVRYSQYSMRDEMGLNENNVIIIPFKKDKALPCSYNTIVALKAQRQFCQVLRSLCRKDGDLTLKRVNLFSHKHHKNFFAILLCEWKRFSFFTFFIFFLDTQRERLFERRSLECCFFYPQVSRPMTFLKNTCLS